MWVFKKLNLVWQKAQQGSSWWGLNSQTMNYNSNWLTDTPQQALYACVYVSGIPAFLNSWTDFHQIRIRVCGTTLEIHFIL